MVDGIELLLSRGSSWISVVISMLYFLEMDVVSVYQNTPPRKWTNEHEQSMRVVTTRAVSETEQSLDGVIDCIFVLVRCMIPALQ